MKKQKPKLDVKVPGTLNEQFCVISRYGTGGLYALFDSDNALIATCTRPTTLANYAFDSGALCVCHDYNLREAEL